MRRFGGMDLNFTLHAHIGRFSASPDLPLLQ